LPRKVLSYAALTLVLPWAGLAQNITVTLADKPVLKARLESGVVKARDRDQVEQSLFSGVGCAIDRQQVTHNSANLICTLPGESASAIIVGGHLDFAHEGQGIVDDWSGVSLLPSLYQTLKKEPRKHTYIFVAFEAEETGLEGSGQYVRKMTKENKASTRAFVNLECLGMGPTVVWQSRAARTLLDRLYEVAGSLGTTMNGVNVDQFGDDDSHPFLSAHIPVVTLHSLTPENLKVIHSRRDNLGAIDMDQYYASYKLIAMYLAYLDQKTE